jgi:hypothetical protein
MAILCIQLSMTKGHNSNTVRIFDFVFSHKKQLWIIFTMKKHISLCSMC